MTAEFLHSSRLSKFLDAGLLLGKPMDYVNNKIPLVFLMAGGHQKNKTGTGYQSKISFYMGFLVEL